MNVYFENGTFQFLYTYYNVIILEQYIDQPLSVVGHKVLDEYEKRTKYLNRIEY